MINFNKVDGMKDFFFICQHDSYYSNKCNWNDDIDMNKAPVGKAALVALCCCQSAMVT